MYDIYVVCMAVRESLSCRKKQILYTNNTINTSTMKVTINEETLDVLLTESGQHYSRCEAFAYLYSEITSAEEQTICISFNALAKVWRWDNHLVSSFLTELSDARIITLRQHTTKTVSISFTKEFGSGNTEIHRLFSLLTMKRKKTSKSEAFFRIIQMGASQKCCGVTPEPLSYRQLAREFGWSHHTVSTFIGLMEQNHIVCLTPSTDGKRFAIRLCKQN